MYASFDLYDTRSTNARPEDVRSKMCEHTRACAGRIYNAGYNVYMSLRCSRVCNYRILRNTTHLDYIARVIRTSRGTAVMVCVRACVSIRQMFPRSGIYFTMDN